VIEVLMLQLGGEEQPFRIKIKQNRSKVFCFDKVKALFLKAPPYRSGSRLIFIFFEAHF
jgi:hypothetical protein